MERDSTALAVVLRAAAVMGGELGLGRIQRVRMDMMTQWQRTGFRDVPWTDRPSFERHYDVRDSVAITAAGGAFGPQSVAYVDERGEIFAYTRDRRRLWTAVPPGAAGAPGREDGP